MIPLTWFFPTFVSTTSLPEMDVESCREIARVLKPNGIAIIADKSYTKKYGEIFAMEGLTVEFFPPSFDGSLRGIVKAVKN